MSDFPITITDEAWTRIGKYMEKHPGKRFRISVKGGGCSGLEYVLAADDRELPIDMVVEQDGVTAVCDQKSAKFLAGSTLVWTGNLIGGGLSLENPNAERSCGCGTSFTPKKAS